MNTELRGLLRFSPRLILIATILVFLITNKLIALRFAGYFIITELLSIFLKGVIGTTLPTVKEIYRPTDGGDCMGCGIMFKCAENGQCVSVGDQIGMPSGHSLTTIMAATFWIMWIWKEGEGSTVSKLVRSGLLAILALAVVISRTTVLENCHTIPQVIVGSIIGAALGVGFYYFDAFLQERFPGSIGA